MWETLCKLKCLPPLIQSLLRATSWKMQAVNAEQHFVFEINNLIFKKKCLPEFKRVLWKKCIIKDILSVSKSLFFHITIFSLLQVDTALVVLSMCALQCHQQIFRFGIFAFSFSKKRVHRLWILNFLTSWQRGYIVFDLL